MISSSGHPALSERSSVYLDDKHCIIDASGTETAISESRSSSLIAFKETACARTQISNGKLDLDGSLPSAMRTDGLSSSTASSIMSVTQEVNVCSYRELQLSRTMVNASGVKSSGTNELRIAKSRTRAAKEAKHWIRAKDTLVLVQADGASSSGQWCSSFPLSWQASLRHGGQDDELEASAWASLSSIPKTASSELCSRYLSTSLASQVQLGHVCKKSAYPLSPTDLLPEAELATLIERWMMTPRYWETMANRLFPDSDQM